MGVFGLWMGSLRVAKGSWGGGGWKGMSLLKKERERKREREKGERIQDDTLT